MGARKKGTFSATGQGVLGTLGRLSSSHAGSNCCRSFWVVFPRRGRGRPLIRGGALMGEKSNVCSASFRFDRNDLFAYNPPSLFMFQRDSRCHSTPARFPRANTTSQKIMRVRATALAALVAALCIASANADFGFGGLVTAANKKNRSPPAPLNLCRPNPCPEHCDCVDLGDDYKCNCLKPEPLNPCRPNPCPPGRECIDVRGKAECIRPSPPTKSPAKSPTKVCFSR